MKKLAVLAIAVAGLMAVVPVAQAAATTTSTFAAGFKSGKPGTKAKPRPGTLSLTAAVANSDGTQPPAVNDILLKLDKNLKLNGKYFASCKGSTLDKAHTANVASCHKAIVGTGSATAMLGSQRLTFKTTFFNGPGGKSLVIYVACNEIPGITSSITAPIVGKTIKVTIPPPLKHPLPGANPSLTGLTVTKLGATKKVGKKKVGYVESTGSTAGKYRFGATFTFPGTGQPNLSNTTTVRAA